MASLAFDQADRAVRALVTPEGVDLRVRLAAVSERGIALVIDLTIIMGSLLLLTLAAGSLLATFDLENVPLAQIIWMLGFFVLRNFYFTLFECSRRSATPGKRLMGLRVVARDGAALSADAVIARNAMRELELYIPLIVLFSRGEGIEAWILLAGIVWCGIFVLFPLFNRDRLRAGDLIAGTWVLKAPKQKMLPDLTTEKPAEAAFAFTTAHLDAYGVKELQVLEQVLRMSEPTAMEAVATQIRTKIGWTARAHEADKDFLSAYYAALRRRLEQRLLLGVRKKDKHDTI
ncbi:MAG: RDD family protein [Alphaproteobacteria bacterium]|nr:RDD family protein [Alphaproteobacteria bacterium]